MSGVQIARVESKKDLKRFIRFPWTVYRDDRNWVPPLIMDVKEKLDLKKNPFFEHAERELLLAYRDGEVTGRVAGIVDRNHNSFHQEKIVFFGMYESLNDLETAAALLEAVSAWGRERGMDTLRGTVNLSLNDECAFLLKGFDSPPVVMMPYNPEYYLDLMDRCGMVKAKDLYAFKMDKDHQTAGRVREIVRKIQDETSITCRPILRKNLKREAAKILHIYNNAWEKNWGFVPWTEHEIEHMVARLKRVADMDLVILAEDRGVPIGFAFGLPNYNEILARINGRLFPFGLFKFLLGRKKIRGMRALVFGIVKEFRNSGASYLLFNEIERQGLRKGFEWGETSWQLEDNEPVNRFIVSLGGRLYKEYRIYEKKMI